MSKKFSVVAKNGMVASSQPLATLAGVQILMNGGNAIDAATATAAVLGVVESSSLGIGSDFPRHAIACGRAASSDSSC